jgi:D-glycero-D-manno-heptose 1,7-bisphosphate phosphatase
MIDQATNRAVFLDRDGTLVYARHYPTRTSDLRLYDGIGSELRLIQETGFKLVVVTNQAGVARGYFTEADLSRMHDYLTGLLAQSGAQLDGIYHCPHHPDGIVAELAVRCACRKPQPGMLLRAARDLAINLPASWLVGDILDDIEAGNVAGCRTVLVDLDTESLPQSQARCPDYVARNTLHALRIIQAVEHITGEDGADLSYRPRRWMHGSGVGARP